MPTNLYRPNALGSYQGFFTHTGINEINDNSDSTNWYTESTSGVTATLNFANPTRIGSPSSVTVYFRCNSSYTNYAFQAKTAVYNGSSLIYGNVVSVPKTTRNVTTTYTTNPWTGNPWTWSELDSLQFGGWMKQVGSSNYGQFFDTWIEITSTSVAKLLSYRRRKL